jgi:hypothetical protein
MAPPTTPDMSSPSYSPTSSVLSVSPPNPPGIEDSFKVGNIDHSGYPTFTVNHFNGPVTYSSEGCLSRNLDSLDPDFISILRGSIVSAADTAEGAGSINPFIKGLFSGKVIATQLEGWGVKGQIWSLGLTKVSKRNANVFEVGLNPDEFSSWCKEPLVKSVVDGLAKEKAEQMRNILGLQEIEMIIEQYKVISECLFVMHC